MTSEVEASRSDGHEARAKEHAVVADALKTSANNEWAAVCYFYSAYRYIKAALLADPIFDDEFRLKAKNVNLCSEDRNANKHQGGRGMHSARLGINEIVSLLYPSIRTEYRLLHEASVQVRYYSGSHLSMDTAAEYLDKIRAAYQNGTLVAGA